MQLLYSFNPLSVHVCNSSMTVCISGSTMITVGEYQKRLGGAEREFLQTSAATFLTPLRNFLEGDWRTISVSLQVFGAYEVHIKTWC